MMDIKIFTNGSVQGGGPSVGLIFFDMLLYYFIYVIIKTLYISSFIVVYIIYFTHCQYCCVLKNYTLATRNVSSPTVFDLDG